MGVLNNKGVIYLPVPFLEDKWTEDIYLINNF